MKYTIRILFTFVSLVMIWDAKLFSQNQIRLDTVNQKLILELPDAQIPFQIKDAKLVSSNLTVEQIQAFRIAELQNSDKPLTETLGLDSIVAFWATVDKAKQESEEDQYQAISFVPNEDESGGGVLIIGSDSFVVKKGSTTYYPSSGTLSSRFEQNIIPFLTDWPASQVFSPEEAKEQLRTVLKGDTTGLGETVDGYGYGGSILTPRNLFISGLIAAAKREGVKMYYREIDGKYEIKTLRTPWPQTLSMNWDQTLFQSLIQKPAPDNLSFLWVIPIILLVFVLGVWLYIRFQQSVQIFPLGKFRKLSKYTHVRDIDSGQEVSAFELVKAYIGGLYQLTSNWDSNLARQFASSYAIDDKGISKTLALMRKSQNTAPDSSIFIDKGPSEVLIRGEKPTQIFNILKIATNGLTGKDKVDMVFWSEQEALLLAWAAYDPQMLVREKQWVLRSDQELLKKVRNYLLSLRNEQDKGNDYQGIPKLLKYSPAGVEEDTVRSLIEEIKLLYQQEDALQELSHEDFMKRIQAEKNIQEELNEEIRKRLSHLQEKVDELQHKLIDNNPAAAEQFNLGELFRQKFGRKLSEDSILDLSKKLSQNNIEQQTQKAHISKLEADLKQLDHYTGQLQEYEQLRRQFQIQNGQSLGQAIEKSERENRRLLESSQLKLQQQEQRVQQMVPVIDEVKQLKRKYKLRTDSSLSELERQWQQNHEQALKKQKEQTLQEIAELEKGHKSQINALQTKHERAIAQLKADEIRIQQETLPQRKIDLLIHRYGNEKDQHHWDKLQYEASIYCSLIKKLRKQELPASTILDIGKPEYALEMLVDKADVLLQSYNQQVEIKRWIDGNEKRDFRNQLHITIGVLERLGVSNLLDQQSLWKMNQYYDAARYIGPIIQQRKSVNQLEEAWKNFQRNHPGPDPELLQFGQDILENYAESKTASDTSKFYRKLVPVVLDFEQQRELAGDSVYELKGELLGTYMKYFFTVGLATYDFVLYREFRDNTQTRKYHLPGIEYFMQGDLGRLRSEYKVFSEDVRKDDGFQFQLYSLARAMHVKELPAMVRGTYIPSEKLLS